jgi:hypothetical protein
MMRWLRYLLASIVFRHGFVYLGIGSASTDVVWPRCGDRRAGRPFEVAAA